MIQPQHLPAERAKWPSIFRQIMGSGDPYGRQLDGMGAGISSLSKICLVEPHGKRSASPRNSTEKEDLDVDYTFVGLGIENDEVDVAGNCGNMSSAIGPYAYNAGLLPPHVYAQGDGETTVQIRNTNTGKLIASTFRVVGGQAAVAGDYTIDGVTGPGSQIQLDFKDPYGSKTGKVLPTGNEVDIIAGYKVSCVDGANPAIFIRADDVGVDGTILPNDFNKLPDKLDLLERIRKAAAVAMCIATTEDAVPRTIPKIGLVSKSSKHHVLSGQILEAAQTDLVVRFLSDTQPHRAIPLTAALTTAVAARIPGTVVEGLLAHTPVMKDAITIGHASGRLQVNATMAENDPLIPVSGTVYRTAKRLFEGNVFWTDQRAGEAEGAEGYGVGGKNSLGLAFVLESRGQSSKHLFVE
jgi:2-methylaconitate cis-trans-isomerase PrpF